MVGAGLTMEGIFQNYIQYQFMIDRIWSSDSLEEQKWSFLYILLASVPEYNELVPISGCRRLFLSDMVTPTN